MGFADAYLQKSGLRGLLVHAHPHPGLKIIVTIPVYNESGLERCLDSLFLSLEHARIPGDEIPGDEIPGDEIRGEEIPGDEIPGKGSPPRSPIHCEVLILVNAAKDASAAILEQNLRTLEATREWIGTHSHPSMDFHVLLDHSFDPKEAGVGLARKILMDEAVHRFSLLGQPRGIIASLDADAVVDPNYLSALYAHFEEDDTARAREGCSIYFEHPLGPGETAQKEPLPEEVNHARIYPIPDPASVSPAPFGSFDPEVYEAITRYELHLRYYVQAVRSTGYPYAYHTVGSSFAVRAGVYCMEGGMNRRQGGEDFYFIQKVAQRGKWSECNNTRVLASPRPSDRVPFGTGRAVLQFTLDIARARDKGEGQPVERPDERPDDPSQLTTYHPQPFKMLKQLFSVVDHLYDGSAARTLLSDLDPVLADFLLGQEFSAGLAEIRRNSASPAAFRKRFWRWFNMFRIMKFLHYAREHGYPDMEVGAASGQMLAGNGPERSSEGSPGQELRSLLEQYRNLQRNAHP